MLSSDFPQRDTVAVTLRERFEPTLSAIEDRFLPDASVGREVQAVVREEEPRRAKDSGDSPIGILINPSKAQFSASAWFTNPRTACPCRHGNRVALCKSKDFHGYLGRGFMHLLSASKASILRRGGARVNPRDTGLTWGG